MSEIRLTVSQAAGEIGETVHVLRNWMKEFKDYIPLEKSEGGYNLFTQEAIDVLQRIKKMHRDENLSTKQIASILSGAEKPKATEEETNVVTTEMLRGLFDEQRTFHLAMLQRLEDQQKSFEDFVQRRDAQVLLMLNEMEERKQRRKKPWYKRLFQG